MIYLDYSATTPVNKEVLDTFNKVCLEFPGNPNSLHNLGVESKTLIDEATNQIAKLLNIKANEIIYTSGATESNNTAIKGIAEKYKNRGKRILTTKLEHSSTYGALSYLQKNGFEVEFIDLDEKGQINIEDLKNKLTKETILVTINAVNSEIGIKQDINEIGKFVGLQDGAPEERWPYDYALFDIDSNENLEIFDIYNADKKYFVTAFDLYSLRKGVEILENLDRTMEITKILFSYVITKEDEEYLNFLSLECKVKWNEYTMYFPISEENDKVFEENQRISSLKLRRLSGDYKESLSYVIQDILEEKHISKILRIIKE